MLQSWQQGIIIIIIIDIIIGSVYIFNSFIVFYLHISKYSSRMMTDESGYVDSEEEDSGDMDVDEGEEEEDQDESQELPDWEGII